MPIMIEVENLSKTFILHTQGGIRLPVFDTLNLSVESGECLCLTGPSGAGKSTLLRSLYGNYAPSAGAIRVRQGKKMVAMDPDNPRVVMALRRKAIGYVSQFLRVIPRVSTIDIVTTPAIASGMEREVAIAKGQALLTSLNVSERLWSLAPATFSGGEQQRINVARGFLPGYPVLLLDEPTASLDAENRDRVVDLILRAKADGSAVVVIVHDTDVRDRIADRLFDVTRYSEAA